MKLLNKGIFVTATDTEVGKTIVAAGISVAMKDLGFRVAAMKPLASGAIKDAAGWFSLDARFLAQAVGLDRETADMNPVCLRKPLAPLAAAEAEGTTIDLQKVFDAFARLRDSHDFLVVEGIGGLRVPITTTYDLRDLVRDFSLPVIIVARAGLGTINHTLLTIESLHNANITIHGVVLNNASNDWDPSFESNARMIERCSCVPVIGKVPFIPSLDLEEKHGRALAGHAVFREIALSLVAT